MVLFFLPYPKNNTMKNFLRSLNESSLELSCVGKGMWLLSTIDAT